MKKLSLLLILLLTFSANAQSEGNSYDKTSVVKIGDSMPSFTYIDSKGDTKKSDDFKGKVVLINFFATWCGSCMVEMPFLEKQIWDKYKDNPNFKLISFGRDHDLAEMKDFVKKKGFGFPISPDKGKLIYNKFATQYIPRNYLIDKNGKVVYVSIGFSEEEFEILKEKIKSLMQ
ncbi:TlpA family protein disulfide reductase [Flavobacterium aquiphilum]|uniref:TlpA family protein disulfide reductase n=1 Tax=Flavobacterium aquiphilum TaxID=3003261 RepID=UPI002480EC8B|nr:TlpA disulfide reductase family protein [Flavobacterium aquiphilum]